MSTVDFSTALFSEVDEPIGAIPTHPEAPLWPREVVTLGLWHARKGVGTRPCSRWVTRDSRALFPHRPERPRLLRLLQTHQDWPRGFLAAPTGLGVIDTDGSEVSHPRREGRRPHQIGRKGLAHHRWLGGGKLWLLLQQWGLGVGGAGATANVAAHTFPGLMQQVDGRMMVLRATGCQAAEGAPTNRTLCPRGAWEDRLLVATVLSRLPLVGHLKQVMHRGWADFQARLACTMAAVNVLVQGHGLQPNASGCGPLSIAEFSL